MGLMLSSVACAVDGTESGDSPTERATTSFAISDATGTSFATVTIQSDDPADLALTADDFELVAIPAEKLGVAAEGGTGTLGDGAPSTDSTAGADYAIGTDIDLSNEVLGDGVAAVELVERSAPDYRAPFRDRYYYSLVNNVKAVSVRRHAVFNRVYMSVSYRTVANGYWYSQLNDYKVSNKETKVVPALENTYEMRLKVRARNTNDYDHEFIR